jgi:hypothetical protein
MIMPVLIFLVVRFGDQPVLSTAEFIHLTKEIPLGQRMLSITRGEETPEFPVPEGQMGVALRDIIATEPAEKADDAAARSVSKGLGSVDIHLA